MISQLASHSNSNVAEQWKFSAEIFSSTVCSTNFTITAEEIPRVDIFSLKRSLIYVVNAYSPVC